MSDTNSRLNWDVEERVQHQQELAERREFWEKQQSARKEQEQRDQKRGELQGYLERRRREWRDTTGTTPPMDVLARWQEEFMDEQELVYQAEREAKIAEAEADIFG